MQRIINRRTVTEGLFFRGACMRRLGPQICTKYVHVHSRRITAPYLYVVISLFQDHLQEEQAPLVSKLQKRHLSAVETCRQSTSWYLPVCLCVCVSHNLSLAYTSPVWRCFGVYAEIYNAVMPNISGTLPLPLGLPLSMKSWKGRFCRISRV
jgi:hypothetical protein